MSKYQIEHDDTWNSDIIFPANVTLDEYLSTIDRVPYVEVLNDTDLAIRVLDFLNSDTEDLEKTVPTNG